MLWPLYMGVDVRVFANPDGSRALNVTRGGGGGGGLTHLGPILDGRSVVHLCNMYRIQKGYFC